jgi:hypothetical protein
MSDAEMPSTVRDAPWLHAASPTLQREGFAEGSSGKWCIVRPGGYAIDHAWARVRAAVQSGRLQLAKVATAAIAWRHGGTHVICVYCPFSSNRDDVMRVRQVLRELRFAEELGYKTDQATRDGVYGTPDEWLYRG